MQCQGSFMTQVSMEAYEEPITIQELLVTWQKDKAPGINCISVYFTLKFLGFFFLRHSEGGFSGFNQ